MSRPQHLRIALYLWIVVVSAASLAQVATAHEAAAQEAAAQQDGTQQVAAPEPIAPLATYDELIGVLMSESESLAWARLRTEAERQLFVDTFWQVRDPTPGTEVNEVRRVFERRAERASRLFAEGDVPGYQTDRGRVMMVLGLPDTQEMRALLAEGDPELVWSYRREPLNDDALFERFEGGYRLFPEIEIDLDNQTFLASLESELRMQLARAVGGRDDAIAKPKEEPEEESEETPEEEPEADDENASELVGETDDEPEEGTDPDVEDDTEAEGADEGPTPVRVAPEVQVWMQLVFGGTGRDDLELRQRFDYFPATDATYTVLSFKVGKEALEFVVPGVDEDDEGSDGEDDGEVQQEEDPQDAEATEVAADGFVDEAETDESDTGRDVEVEGEADEIAAADDTLDPGDADEDNEEDASLDDVGLDDTDDDGLDRVDEDDVEGPREPRAHLKMFGAVLQGEPGSEDTVHRFIVPHRLLESDGDEVESPTLSFGVSLYPGEYRLAWGVLDETTGNAVTRDETFEVPDFAVDELTLTRPLMARPPHLTDETAIDPRTIYEGMRLGRMVVNDDLSRTFRRDDIVDVILLATGWSSDPGALGKPRLEVQYRLLAGLEGSRSLATIPPQVLDFHILGQQIPLAQINRLEPGGDYRIEVTVKDLVSGVERVVQTPFHLEADDRGGEPQ